MVTTNISVKHGLVNGTSGTVVDVLVQDGIAYSVLIAVRRRTATRSGFSGPAFTDNVERFQLDVAENLAVIAIGRVSIKVRGENKQERDSSRSQFPLMLATAVTIHKARRAL